MERLLATESSKTIPIRADHIEGELPCRDDIIRKSLPAFGTERRIMEKRRAKDGILLPMRVMIFCAVIR